MRKRVLVVDDELGVRESVKAVLNSEYEVLTATNAQECLRLFHQESPHLILLDIRLPSVDGLALLQTIRAEDQDVPVIMLTGLKTLKTAVDAMKLGAADYVTKPFDADEFRLIVAKTLAAQELEQEVLYLRAQLVNRYAFHNLVGKSRAMQEVYSKIEQITDTRTTVLIMGESGTGKELVARALHFNSSRRDRPFIALNCAALPENLIESELFGHEKGSFTDALARRLGKFELAHGGSLFLDEIGDLSLNTQAKLLRVLQEREFTRVGGDQAVKVDVRIITATNKNLESLIARGQFRDDLYYRINVASLYLPPLRNRREDIPLLAKHFAVKLAEKEDRPTLEFSKEALETLTQHHWPGNVRELENVIEQALVWSRGTMILAEHLPIALRTKTSPVVSSKNALRGCLSLEQSVQEFERELIVDALKQTGYVQTHAAALLGITRRMLKYRMDLLGISGGDLDPVKGRMDRLKE